MFSPEVYCLLVEVISVRKKPDQRIIGFDVVTRVLSLFRFYDSNRKNLFIRSQSLQSIIFFQVWDVEEKRDFHAFDDLSSQMRFVRFVLSPKPDIGY